MCGWRVGRIRVCGGLGGAQGGEGATEDERPEPAAQPPPEARVES